MRTQTKAKLGVVGIAAAALSIAATVPAHADYAPGPNDIVGVGGDTPQFDLAFGADGDVAGALGFNATSPINRLVTFNATADGNARAAYADGSTLASPNQLNPTVTLRAGTSPVQRVQSSGAAINALLADTGATEKINFVFSASIPTAAQQAQAGPKPIGNGWGFLHVVQIGDDAVQIAGSSTTNAPNDLTRADLLGIYKGTYTHWNDIPGHSTASSDAIVPLLPPSSSSIYKTFLADLKTENNNAAVTLATTVKTVEQNDPSAITGTATPDDAIVPFSSARLDLYTSGYFHDPSTVFPGGAALTPGVKLLNGTGAYSSPVNHYVIFRQSDADSTTPMEPGGSLNWVQTLFSNPADPTSADFDKSSYQALIQAAGTTPDYIDLGNVNSGP